MASTIKHVVHYSYVISNFTTHQIIAWLSLIKCKDYNLIVETIHNILYNYNLPLTIKHKEKLKPFLEIFMSIDSNLKKDSKHIIIQKNPKAIQVAFQVIYDIYGSTI